MVSLMLSGDVRAVDEFAHGVADGIGPAFVAVDIAELVLVDAPAAYVDGEHLVRKHESVFGAKLLACAALQAQFRCMDKRYVGSAVSAGQPRVCVRRCGFPLCERARGAECGAHAAARATVVVDDGVSPYACADHDVFRLPHSLQRVKKHGAA